MHRPFNGREQLNSSASNPVIARAVQVVTKKPTTIDEYLAAVPAAQRKALNQLRKTIRTIIPKAEECISYSMPAFRVAGGIVGGFAARGHGCSYYPFSGSTLGTLKGDLADYSQTKSALHFTPEKPLPVALVRKLIRTRLAEMNAKD
jgi:uncharacterized protein YdhG (YjbR/CyaY superfamily)